MKIYTDFKDYYDKAISTDQDHVVYRRFKHTKNNTHREKENCFYVGFCGKVYRGMYEYYNETKIFFYSFEKYRQYLMENTNEKNIYEYVFGNKSKEYSKNLKVVDIRYNLNNIKSFFNGIHHNDKFDSIEPIYVIDRYTTVYNERLSKYDFIKVKDPYTAYQELRMYISNMAMPEKVIPPLSDEMNIHTHGFDKWSFRKEPTKKRK